MDMNLELENDEQFILLFLIFQRKAIFYLDRQKRVYKELING